ncbi:MAG: helix-turn-helix domain-containing protein [Pseudomonadota bacterium]
MSDEQDSAVQELPLMGAGDRLRAAREAMKVDLEHITAQTRIPVRHLQSIEAGDFDSLPSRTYAIGFARSYAREVGLDDAEIADEVRSELADMQSHNAVLAAGMEPGDSAKLPSAGLAWFGAFAALLLAVGVVTFVSTYFGAGSGPGSLIAQSDQNETSEGELASEAGANGQTEIAANSAGQVVFTALEDGIWVRFYEDGGERLLEKQMTSGESYELPTDALEPRINTGRPDAFAITIDGQSVPKLSEEPITLGDTPISAAALLARADVPSSALPAPN